MSQERKSKKFKKFRIGSKQGNPLVFLDICIGNIKEKLKRIRIELFVDILPITANNFRMLCTGEVKSGTDPSYSICYKGCPIHRIIPGFMMQSGDITNGNGKGGMSATNTIFDDEGFGLKHIRGSVSMAHENNTNKSQFFITFVETPWLNGKHVVFGQVIEDDLHILDTIEKIEQDYGKPRENIIIEDCGQLCGENLPIKQMIPGLDF